MSFKSPKWIFRIRHILQAIEKIETCTKNLSYDQFEEDWIVMDAVQMNLLIIGEASRHIPESVINDYPEIEEDIRERRVLGQK